MFDAWIEKTHYLSLYLLSFYCDPSAEGWKDVEKMRGMEGWMVEGVDEGGGRKDRPLIFLKNTIYIKTRTLKNKGGEG